MNFELGRTAFYWHNLWKQRFAMVNSMNSQELTSDAEIREALHTKRLSHSIECPHTLVIDELGLAHAKSRVDVAVINGSIHGYEIKSEKDTLSRLPFQLETYEQALEKLTIVCAPRHTASVNKISPDWVGILEASRGARGGINFRSVQRGRKNPTVAPEVMAQLLWKPELVKLLTTLGESQKNTRKTRQKLCERLAELVPKKELTRQIRETMKLRRNWRDL